MNYEELARNNHRSGMNCAMSVYSAFKDVNSSFSSPPKPRDEGGKCGAVLAAEKVLGETGCSEEISVFEQSFQEKYGSLYCRELLGGKRGKCNDYVGTAAGMVSGMIA